MTARYAPDPIPPAGSVPLPDLISAAHAAESRRRAWASRPVTVASAVLERAARERARGPAKVTSVERNRVILPFDEFRL